MARFIFIMLFIIFSLKSIISFAQSDESELITIACNHYYKNDLGYKIKYPCSDLMGLRETNSNEYILWMGKGNPLLLYIVSIDRKSFKVTDAWIESLPD